MATQLFLLDYATGNYGPWRGNREPKLAGTTTSGWGTCALSLSRGAGPATSHTTATVAGPTSGLETQQSGTTYFDDWVSDPLAADVTISGTVTCNIWASEAAMTANVAINVAIDRIDPFMVIQERVLTTARVTELGTTLAAENFTATPTSTNFTVGDRIRVRVFGDDAGTMASGLSFSASIGGNTGGATGDTWVQFTENLTFASNPAGSVVYLRDTASDVATAAVDREAWTTRGASAKSDVTTTVAGPTAPIQITDTADGTVVDWWTPTLSGFTLSGMVVVSLWTESNGANFTKNTLAELAVCQGDGSSPVVWSVGSGGRLPAAEGSYSIELSAPDVTVASGQRLRIRFYADDGANAMLASTYTMYYDGPTPGAQGDSFLTFPQTMTTGSAAAPPVPHHSPYPPLIAQ